MKHIVIVRTGSTIIDMNSYNCQELGLAKALANKGYRVSLIMAGIDRNTETIENENHLSSVQVFYLKVKSLDIRLGYFVGIDTLLKQLNPTIIQIHDMGIFMSWWVSRWAKKHDVPCFLIQGTYQISPKPILGLADRLITYVFGRRVLRKVAGVGCKSYMASHFVKKYHKIDTSIVHIGLDESKFATSSDKDWRKELGIVDKKVLLYIGKLEERRRPLFLIDIIMNLPSEYVLVMVGNGPLYEETKKKIALNHLERRVFLLGLMPQTSLPSLYSSSDLFLLPSSYEIYGMVIMEAMYYGLPVVSSHSAGAEIIIDDTKDGVVVDRFDIEEWSQAIKDICDDKEKNDRMKVEAKRKIRDEFLWEKAVDTFLDLYNI